MSDNRHYYGNHVQRRNNPPKKRNNNRGSSGGGGGYGRGGGGYRRGGYRGGGGGYGRGGGGYRRGGKGGNNKFGHGNIGTNRSNDRIRPHKTTKKTEAKPFQDNSENMKGAAKYEEMRKETAYMKRVNKYEENEIQLKKLKNERIDIINNISCLERMLKEQKRRNEVITEEMNSLQVFFKENPKVDLRFGDIDPLKERKRVFGVIIREAIRIWECIPLTKLKIGIKSRYGFNTNYPFLKECVKLAGFDILDDRKEPDDKDDNREAIVFDPRVFDTSFDMELRRLLRNRLENHYNFKELNENLV